MNDHSSSLPKVHADFLARAIERLKADARIVGVAIGGSYLTSSFDEFSDLDLLIVVEPDSYDSMMAVREDLAAGLGPLLAAFTGEHVGEPRLLICLYGPPLLHVDLKFVSLNDASVRIENPAVLFERDGRLTDAFVGEPDAYPQPDLQWIEDRFWIWIHYAASKIGRGELMEACDFLSFLRLLVLGPLALKSRGARPSGVRKIEFVAPELAAELQSTLPDYSRGSLIEATEAAAKIYRGLRAVLATDSLTPRTEAEVESMKYLSEVKRSIDP